jgi:hypothetical protein
MKAHEEYVTWTVLAPILTELRQAAIGNNEKVIKNTLMQLVQGYNPAEGGSAL